MRELTATLVVCALLLVTACGRVEEKATYMSQQEAMDVLASAPRGFQARDSLENLADEVTALVESGEVDVSGGRQAVKSKGGTSQVKSLFSLMSQNSGDMNAVAEGMVQNAEGNGEQATSVLNTILGILQVALPILTILFPPLVPIATAVIALIPTIIQIISQIFAPPA